MDIHKFIESALREDLDDYNGQIPTGDHATLSTIPEYSLNSAYAVAKESGVVSGVEIAKLIFKQVNPSVEFQQLIQDGEVVNPGDIIFKVKGSARGILTAERTALNFMQRMSGIATLTQKFVRAVEGTGVKILDTRKTTPNLRYFEKLAVKTGGGENHRFGLYDMIMIKDNHIDFCGGIEAAIRAANHYLQEKDFSIPIEIETRNMEDVKRILKIGGVQRIMLDNFSVDKVKEAVKLIDKKFETEVSGGINLETISAYAEAGPDFISVGALTHSYKSLDISLKASV
jgi:nicotinate-nucleotide pyrophosphorylase (carboxylating)